MAILLTVLKYLGLALAAGSSIWGTVNVLTISTPDGRKKLTSAGRVSIALTILGLIISFTSESVQRQIAAAQVVSDAQRAIASQPLTGLELTWDFRGLDNGLVQVLKRGNDDAMKFLEDAQGERDAQQNGALYRADQLYPFLLALSRELVNDSTTERESTKKEDPAKQGGTDVLVLLPLDDDQNTVLSFGLVSANMFRGKTNEAPTPAGVRSVETQNNAEMGNGDLANWPELDAGANNARITWHLDPTSFAKSISRQNQSIIPTARFPSVLHIALLFDIHELPFKEGNFAAPLDQDFWFRLEGRHARDASPAPVTLNRGFSSSVRIIPNRSSMAVYNYDLHSAYETRFLDSHGEIEPGVRCVIFEYLARNN